MHGFRSHRVEVPFSEVFVGEVTAAVFDNDGVSCIRFRKSLTPGFRSLREKADVLDVYRSKEQPRRY